MNSHKNYILENLTKWTAWLLPLIQFGLQWLPSINVFNGLFLSSEVFYFTSFLTLLFSILLIFLYQMNPYFRIVINRKQLRKYQEYLRKTDLRFNSPEEINETPLVSPPYELTDRKLSLIFVALGFVCAFGFISIGVAYKSVSLANVGNFIIVLQSLLYTITFLSGVFVLITYAQYLHDRAHWKSNQRERIGKAINLAKENNGFREFPNVNFYFARENHSVAPAQFIVEVWVNEQKYRIVTDQNANVLHAVYKVEEKEQG